MGVLYSLLLAATETNLPTAGGDWGDVLKTYGYAAPFILFLLYISRELRAELKQREAKIDELTTKITDKVIPLVTESNATLKESVEIIKASATTTHQALSTLDGLQQNITRLEGITRELKEQ